EQVVGELKNLVLLALQQATLKLIAAEHLFQQTILELGLLDSKFFNKEDSKIHGAIKEVRDGIVERQPCPTLELHAWLRSQDETFHRESDVRAEPMATALANWCGRKKKSVLVPSAVMWTSASAIGKTFGAENRLAAFLPLLSDRQDAQRQHHSEPK